MNRVLKQRGQPVEIGNISDSSTVVDTVNKNLEDDNKSYFSPTIKENSRHYFKDILKLFKEPVYLSSSLSLTFLYFISTALTFWSTDYLTNVMKFSKLQVTTVFLIICTTAPLFGVIFGGIFVQKYYNGYENKNSIAFVVIQLALSTFFIIPVYYFTELWMIGLMLWSLLFFGSSTIPTIQGITISTLPHSLRASGNSFTNLLIFTIGFSGAPLFYGAVFYYTKDFDEKLAFVLTLSLGFVALLSSIICALVRYKRFADPKSQENKNLQVFGNKEEEFDIPEKSIDLAREMQSIS